MPKFGTAPLVRSYRTKLGGLKRSRRRILRRERRKKKHDNALRESNKTLKEKGYAIAVPPPSLKPIAVKIFTLTGWKNGLAKANSGEQTKVRERTKVRSPHHKISRPISQLIDQNLQGITLLCTPRKVLRLYRLLTVISRGGVCTHIKQKLCELLYYLEILSSFFDIIKQTSIWYYRIKSSISTARPCMVYTLQR